MPKKIVFRFRLDQTELDQLDQIARDSKRTKSQTIRAAIAIMAQLFASNDISTKLSSQTHNLNQEGRNLE